MINKRFWKRNESSFRMIGLILLLIFMVLGTTMCSPQETAVEEPAMEEEAPAAEEAAEASAEEEMDALFP